MKQIKFILMTIAILLFAQCKKDEAINPPESIVNTVWSVTYTPDEAENMGYSVPKQMTSLYQRYSFNDSKNFEYYQLASGVQYGTVNTTGTYIYEPQTGNIKLYYGGGTEEGIVSDNVMTLNGKEKYKKQ